MVVIVICGMLQTLDGIQHLVYMIATTSSHACTVSRFLACPFVSAVDTLRHLLLAIESCPGVLELIIVLKRLSFP